MGQDIVSMNIHICGLDIKNTSNHEKQMKILNVLFPKTDIEQSTKKYIVKYSEKPKWNAFIYSEKNTTNFSLIKKVIYDHINKYNGINKDDKLKKDKKGALKNHMIILFVSDENLDNLLLEEFNEAEEELNENFPLILFLFNNIERNNLYYRDTFFDFSYIQCINLSKIPFGEDNKVSQEDLIAAYLKKILYNNYDSYFTERGHRLIDEIDPLSNEPLLGIYFPIILVGSPGAGKSTFINILNGSRISRASTSFDPVTTKSAIYDVKIPGDENIDYQIDDERLKQEAFIRFIDTPGFDLKKDADTALNEIKRTYKDFKEGKERIPIVLYFLNKNGRDFTREEGKANKIIEILQYLKKTSSKVIFVVTDLNEKEKWRKKGSFIQFFKERQLEGLIENDFSNVIYCQNAGPNANTNGIKKVFRKIYDYTNFIEDNDYNQTEQLYNQSLIEEIKKRKTFDEKLNFIKSKTNLFNEFHSKEDIIKYGNKKSIILMSSITLAASLAGAIPIPFADISIVMSIIGTAILSIGKFYGYVWKKISKRDLFSIYNGELYKKEDVNYSENIETYKTIKEILIIVGEIFAKGILTMALLNIDDVLKWFWGVGTIIGMIVGSIADAGIVLKYSSNAKKYFESKCREDDGTIFFCTRCAEYEVIFRQFKQFEKYNLVINNN